MITRRKFLKSIGALAAAAAVPFVVVTTAVRARFTEAHLRALVRAMKSRNIPPYENSYLAVTSPEAAKVLKDLKA